MRNEKRMNRELFFALETGHFISIQILHDQNSHVLLDVTFQGDTPLHIAAREGYQDIVEWILLVKPSLARAPNKDWNRPLHEAAKNGNPEVVRTLLQHRKSSAYLKNKFGETPLIIASRYGHLETVKILLETRSHNDENEMGRSFRVAAYGRYPDVTKAILQNPIKPQLFRRPLLVLLEWDAYNDVAKIILHYLSKPFKIFRLQNSIAGNLYAAVHGGHLEVVKAVLDSPAWNNDLMIEEDEHGRCAIHLAAMNGSWDIINEFMTREDEHGRCAIHVAAMNGSWDIINEFMSRMPDCVEIRSSDHKSLLHFAVAYNQIQIVQNLLLNKSSQKVTDLVCHDHDSFRNTSLHFAAKYAVDPQLVEYLVSFPGVDVNAMNDEGMTALDIASAAAKDNPNCAIIQEKLEAAGGILLSLMPKAKTTSHPSNAKDSKEVRDRDIVNTHMVVASLIATVTFAAIFQIPGGIEDRENIHYGAAKMAFHRNFNIFIFSDTVAFTTSFTVVVAWLVGQLVGNTYFGRQSVLSHMSVVTLLFSIFWTIVAFVSAAHIVVIPPNYEKLESAHKEAYSIYSTLWRKVFLLALNPPIIPLLGSASGLRWFPFKYQNPEYYKYLMYIYLGGITAMIISFIFVPYI